MKTTPARTEQSDDNGSKAEERPARELSPLAEWLLRQWNRPLQWHLAALAIVLIALVPAMDIGDSFSQDEGVYGLQVKALEAGHWASLPPSADIDPDLRYTPWQGRGIAKDGGIVLYSQHPAYPGLLRGIAAVADIDTALLVTGIGGVLIAAAGSWSLAGAIGGVSSRMSFWLLAGSPLLHHSYVLWPHSLGAAAAAWSAFFLVRALRNGSTLAWVSASATMGVGVLFRSESLLWAAGMMLGAFVAVVRRRSLRSLPGLAVVASGVLAAVGLERAVVSQISVSSAQRFDFRGSELLYRPDAGFVEGRLIALRQTLWDGAFWDPDLRRLAQIGFVLFAFGVVGIAVSRWRLLHWVCTGLGVVLLVVRIVASPADPVPGLVVAWPLIVVAAWGCVRLLKRSDPAVESLVLGVAATSCAIILTQYARGTGLNWGGRYFTVLLPAAAVFVAAAWSQRWRVQRRPWNAALLGTTLVLAGVSLVSVHALRSVHGDLSHIVEGQGVPLAISPIRVPLTQWRDDQPWMTVPPGELGQALDLAADAGVRDVVLLWNETPPSISDWTAERIGHFGRDTYGLTIYRLTR